VFLDPFIQHISVSQGFRGCMSLMTTYEIVQQIAPQACKNPTVGRVLLNACRML
jgi:hypothetical protein